VVGNPTISNAVKSGSINLSFSKFLSQGNILIKYSEFSTNILYLIEEFLSFNATIPS